MPVSAHEREAEGLALYLHWPFCLSKCPYCDFNSHVRGSVDQAVWRDALLAEIAATAAWTGKRRVQSIFFGGGTPSLMPPATVAAIIDETARCWELATDAEITLEANPTSVEAEKFAGFRQAGVNRVSIGVQALNDKDLKFLGRGHSAREAREAAELARRLFPRFSFDLIYARPGQTPEAWERELREAMGMAADHLSLYQLTIEQGTGFEGAVRRGEFIPVSTDLAADLYELTQEVCEAGGLPAYEVSNHAKPGAESQHNLTYWRYGEYAGIGPGAHGRLYTDGGLYATANFRKPEHWLEKRRETCAELSGREQAVEMLMMGLRLNEGVSLARFQALMGAPLPEAVLQDLSVQGLLSLSDGRIAATPRGRLLLNGVLAMLLE